ncbi:hypothetical protein P153DRAFT_322473 [Dothidotthia symphoricarpi CBS 119687]|uniref:Uncharacterized protein n=1 Tax=Dothidotthia symphoricarpi CBS 119687 TaxID=1392245 RepID=A0A6A6A3P4_9PLEO|nr:uncharacterized protein P153DRAFT_322473 [Dothidotthia symphoricarpi CBS 119687]KAF2126509.1 hypothetical protein P153DRAFT_322473 [Dothidotthia symphoricarpi CBS 119687]
MSSDEVFFEPDPYASTARSRTTTSTGKTHATPPDAFTKKPKDDFRSPSASTNTIYYLGIIAPHTDNYTVHGPVTSFLHLLPKIEEIVSNSPSAIDKLDDLRWVEDVWGEREPNVGFEKGFRTFVVDGQRGIYTVLRILTEKNQVVHEVLPAAVYTVTAHGPLTNASVKAKGYASTSRLVGSFVERADAKAAATEAMQELVQGLEVAEHWGSKDKSGGVLLAFSGDTMWEVKIVYDDEVFKRAREGFEREDKRTGWRI